jgi:plastocyanin
MHRLPYVASLCWLLCLPQLALPSPSTTSTIQGRVEVRLKLAGGGARPTTRDLGSPPPRDTPDRTRTVVYLEVAPQTAFAQTGGQARMDQRNETFVPYVLAVGAGTSVDFPNNDDIYHNVFSLSGAKKFDLGRYARGRSKSVRFDRPGIVRVFCDIHSHMNAFILVFAHRFFATTAEDGTYRIDGGPAGTYELVAWTDGEIRAERTVAVPAAGETVTMDFVIE